MDMSTGPESFWALIHFAKKPFFSKKPAFARPSAKLPTHHSEDHPGPTGHMRTRNREAGPRDLQEDKEISSAPAPTKLDQDPSNVAGLGKRLLLGETCAVPRSKAKLHLLI